MEIVFRTFDSYRLIYYQRNAFDIIRRIEIIFWFKSGSDSEIEFEPVIFRYYEGEILVIILDFLPSKHYA